jgi:hypothetical protein
VPQLPPPARPKWSSIAATDVRILYGEPVAIIQRKYKTGKAARPDRNGVHADLSGSIFNLPTLKSYLLSMKRNGHDVSDYDGVLNRLIEESKKAGPSQIEVRVEPRQYVNEGKTYQRGELVVRFRRTAGSLIGGLGKDEKAHAYLPHPGVTSMTGPELAQHIIDLKEANIDTGFEEAAMDMLVASWHYIQNAQQQKPAEQKPAEEKTAQPSKPAAP